MIDCVVYLYSFGLTPFSRLQRGVENLAEHRDCAADHVLAENHKQPVDEVFPPRGREHVGGARDGRAEEEAAEDDVGAEAGQHVPADRKPLLGKGKLGLDVGAGEKTIIYMDTHTMYMHVKN